MDLSPVLMEPDLIHQLIDQENSATVVRIDIFSMAGIGNFCGIKTGAGIAHHNQHPLLRVAGNIAFHRFRRIAARSMDDGVGQSLGRLFTAGRGAGHSRQCQDRRQDP